MRFTLLFALYVVSVVHADDCKKSHKFADQQCSMEQQVLQIKIKNLESNPQSLAAISDLSSQLTGLEIACRASLGLCQRTCKQNTQDQVRLFDCSPGGALDSKLASIMAEGEKRRLNLNWSQSIREPAAIKKPTWYIDGPPANIDDGTSSAKKESYGGMVRFRIPFGK